MNYVGIRNCVAFRKISSITDYCEECKNNTSEVSRFCSSDLGLTVSDMQNTSVEQTLKCYQKLHFETFSLGCPHLNSFACWLYRCALFLVLLLLILHKTGVLLICEVIWDRFASLFSLSKSLWRSPITHKLSKSVMCSAKQWRSFDIGDSMKRYQSRMLICSMPQ